MKLLPIITLLALCWLLPSCAAPSDPEFIRTASASINGGPVVTQDGRMMMSSGIQNRNRVHPFFGAP